MKKMLLSLLFLLWAVVMFGQNKQEVVRLKNGSVLRGQVVGEMGDSIALQGADGSLFIFATSDITERTKEAVRQTTVTAHSVTGPKAMSLSSDTLEVKTDLLNSPRFYQNGVRLRGSEVKSLFADNAETARLLQSAKNLNYLATALSFVSGAIVGWEVVDVALNDKKPSGIAIAGAIGSFVGAAALNAVVNDKMRRAVQIYNHGTASLSPRSNDLSLSIGATSDGVGLRICF